MQHKDARAREQRGVDFERRIFGRRADQRDRAVLDIGQHRVLLRLVEAVDLVDEEHGALAERRARLRFGDDAPQIGDAGADRRHALEIRAGRVARSFGERRLAASRRAPEDHRRNRVALDRSAQRAPRPRICSWPTNSSSVCGRIRAASGVASGDAKSDGIARRDVTADREVTGSTSGFFGT